MSRLKTHHHHFPMSPDRVDQTPCGHDSGPVIVGHHHARRQGRVQRGIDQHDRDLGLDRGLGRENELLGMHRRQHDGIDFLLHKIRHDLLLLFDLILALRSFP